MASVICHLINTRVREMREDIAVVETGHGDLGDNHLQEGGKGGEDARLSLLETKSSSGREITTFHDPGSNKHLRMFLVDDLETSGSLEITFM